MSGWRAGVARSGGPAGLAIGGWATCHVKAFRWAPVLVNHPIAFQIIRYLGACAPRRRPACVRGSREPPQQNHSQNNKKHYEQQQKRQQTARPQKNNESEQPRPSGLSGEAPTPRPSASARALAFARSGRISAATPVIILHLAAVGLLALASKKARPRLALSGGDREQARRHLAVVASFQSLAARTARTNEPEVASNDARPDVRAERARYVLAKSDFRMT